MPPQHSSIIAPDKMKELKDISWTKAQHLHAEKKKKNKAQNPGIDGDSDQLKDFDLTWERRRKKEESRVG